MPLVSRINVAAFLLATLFMASSLSDTLRFDDDTMYLYSASLTTTEQRLSRQADIASNISVNEGFAERSEQRAQLREALVDNYRLFSNAILLTRHLTPLEDFCNYDSWLLFLLSISIFGGKTACLTLILLLLYRAGSVSLSVAILCFVLAGPMGSQILNYGTHYTLANHNNFAIAVQQSIYFLLDPGWSHDYLGYYPRSWALLLLAGVSILRWSSCRAQAYLLLPVVALAHSAYGFMALSFYLAVDFLTSACSLYNWRVALGVFGVLVLTEPMLSYLVLVGGAPYVLVPAGVAVLAGLFALAFRKRIKGWWFFQRNPLSAVPLGVVDTIAAGGAVLAIVFYTFHIARETPDFTATYFAGNASGRFASVLRVPIVMGISYIAAGLLHKCIKYVFTSDSTDTPRSQAPQNDRWAWAQWTLFCTAFATVTFFTVFGAPRCYEKQIVPKLRSLKAGELDNRIRKLESGDTTKPNEALFYYALAKDIDTGSHYLDKLLHAEPR